MNNGYAGEAIMGSKVQSNKPGGRVWISSVKSAEQSRPNFFTVSKNRCLPLPLLSTNDFMRLS
jgi:hypothetical protein